MEIREARDDDWPAAWPIGTTWVRPTPSPARASSSRRSTPAGASGALSEYVLDWARTAGYRAMQFNAVVETNTRAFALWRSLGFEVIGTLPEAFRLPDRGYVGQHVMYRRL